MTSRNKDSKEVPVIVVLFPTVFYLELHSNGFKKKGTSFLYSKDVLEIQWSSDTNPSHCA
jgi:uncharacterized protein Veg